MAKFVHISGNSCSICGEALSPSLSYCTTCRSYIGAPNVRRCRTKENLKALNQRYVGLKEKAAELECLEEFENLEQLLEDESSVVVSMSASVARSLVDDPSSIYCNYESLVHAGVRIPANQDNDRHRCAVGGLLFGSYANSIVYGALSLTNIGLPTYGPVQCRIRSVAINSRTSFLEMNSYEFVEVHSITPSSPLPMGYMSCWENKQILALVKVTPKLSVGQTISDWQKELIKSDGINRNKDDFIEAHIFEGFNLASIESIEIFTKKRLRKDEQLDIKIIKHMFNTIKGKTG